jgi:hypothetical protein
MANTNKIPSIIGAGTGLLLFVFLGLLPSWLYGGYAGVLLATGIFGTPLTGALAERALIVFGSVLGVTAVAALFAVFGAAVGAVLSALVRVIPEERKAKVLPKG